MFPLDPFLFVILMPKPMTESHDLQSSSLLPKIPIRAFRLDLEH